jgi:hypothetical protein
MHLRKRSMVKRRDKERALDMKGVRLEMIYLAEFLCTLGRTIERVGIALYKERHGGRRVHAKWDPNNPSWSPGFYEALGRQEWERRRR